MVVIMSGHRYSGAGIMRIGHRMVRVSLMLPVMRHPMRQRFAGDGKGDDREEASCEQLGKRGAGHGGILFEAVHRSESAGSHRDVVRGMFRTQHRPSRRSRTQDRETTMAMVMVLDFSTPHVLRNAKE